MQDPREVLKEYWGYDDFRGIQREIVDHVLQGHDTLGLMPTGGGKSIAFQVPALCLGGLCIVVTPLIALMKDQVENLRRRGILASAVYSGMSSAQIEVTYDNCILGHTSFLYLSPERLESSLFLNKVRRMDVRLITIDEAHCISQWGYDFRPSYLHIKELRQLCPDVPVLALTATATTDVVSDICQQLNFGAEGKVFRMSFERPNLSYVARRADDKFSELLHILKSVDGSAIVYTRNREGTREVAQHLSEAGISANYYHAGVSSVDKEVRQSLWKSDKVRVMVATNAFGMGIDKSNVRLVIHMDLPDSVEAYFQEAGRAGRDGQRAWAVLLWNKTDITTMNRRVQMEFPPKEFCAQIYEELAYFYQLPEGEGAGVTHEFNIGMFCRSFRHFPVAVESALMLLTRAGYLDYREEDSVTSRLMMLCRRDDLYYMNQLTQDDDRVLKALFRNYTGLFSEYVFIEERRVAEESGLESEQVYEILMNLSRQRILNYVPSKTIPRITYMRDRVDMQRVTFAASIYEERRALYERRIAAMVEYVQQTEMCRSRYLLHYFSDDSAHDCGHCDVCLL